MRKLCVSPLQVIDELGASGEYSSMATYIDGLGDDTARTRILNRHINEAQSHIEMRLGVFLYQTRVVTRPVTPGKVRGTDYEVEEDGYSYSRADFRTYGTVYLRRRPVVSVQRAGLRMGNSTQQLAANEWPAGWINPQTRLGVLHILPILGTGGQMGSGSALLLPLISGVLPGHMSVPMIFSVDYTAGFLPTDYEPDGDIDPSTACPDFDVNPLINAVRLRACANLLGVLGRVVAPGGGSIGMDGFSQSHQGARFQSEIEGYKADSDEQLALIESQFPLPVISL